MAAGKNWQAAADKSNKTEQSRVSKKYKGVKKISADVTKGGNTSFADDPSPFLDDDPIVDTMDVGRTHKLDQYSKASGLTKDKAKKVLTETETLQK